MSSDPRNPGEIASDYATNARYVQITAPGFFKIADRNPKRVFIQFWLPVGSTGTILPEPGQNVSITFASASGQGETYTLRDCPSLVTGEWYCFFGGGLGDCYVVECEYLR